MLDKAYLIKRSQLIKRIRNFFDSQGLLEVQTSTLIDNPTTDVYIDSICATVNAEVGPKTIKYLHTSPELEMKKLLSEGCGDIYQICQAFRDNEYGKNNFNEFTMLEYYRVGFEIHDLMDDIANLLNSIGVNIKPEKISYSQAFNDYGDIDILKVDFEQLKNIASGLGLTNDFLFIEDLQMLLFTHLIEPKLKYIPVCFIYDYPKSQSALAKTNGDIALRFELYLNGIEIANGYDELQDPETYRQRFIKENNKRKLMDKKICSIDYDFLSKIQNIIPQCSGVAIGIDRLLSQIK